MGKFWKMAWRNLWRNWRRTAIALTAIVLGLVLLLLMEGLIRGSDQAIFGNAVRLYGGNFQVHAPGYREKANRLPLLPLADPDAVVQVAKSQPHVVAATKRISTGGLATSREGSFPVSITAIEPDAEAELSIQAQHIGAGRFLEEGEGDAVLIGQGLADLLKVGVGDRMTLIGRSADETMRQRTMTVVGIYNIGMTEIEKAMVYITLPEAQSLYGLRDQVTEVAVALDSINNESAALPSLQAALPGYEVDSWATLRPEIKDTLATKETFTVVLGFIVVLIACIGVLNLMLMAVFERTREMGVLAALGMKGRQLMWLFLLEGFLIGVVGAGLGCALGWAVVWLIGQVGIELSVGQSMGGFVALMGSRMYPAITPVDAISRAVVVVVIATLAAFYPAWHASRKEPAAALHTV